MTPIGNRETESSVPHIAVAAGHRRDGLGAAQTALEPTGCSGLTQGKPISSCGFQGRRLEATVNEPVRQGVKIGGIGAQGAPLLLGVAVRDTRHALMGANVHPSGLAVDLAHPCERAGVALGRSVTMPLPEFAHGEFLAEQSRSSTSAE